MASTSETGHAKNVANFEVLISHCTGFGSAYNPAQAAIKLPALNTTHANGSSALLTVNDKLGKLNIAINERQKPFENLDKLTTRVVNALDASGPTQKTVADARTIARKIYGKTSPPSLISDDTPPQTEPAEEKHKKQISVSQQSFDSRLENFKKLIELVEEEPLYVPNETDLKTASLKTFATSLTTLNTAVITAATALDNARTSRDHTLYDLNTGLVDIAYEVKKYVKSVFGARSSEYKQISGIKFFRRYT